MKTLIFPLTLTVGGFLAGWTAWNTGFYGFGILPLVIVAAILLSQRSYTFLFMLGYYLGSAIELLWGVVTFFDGDFLKAAWLWAIQQGILASGWIILKKDHRRRFSRIFFQTAGAFLITIFVPPYAFLGIAHPVTATGYYFPSTGYAGLVLFVVLISTTAYWLVNIRSKSLEARRAAILLTMALTIALGCNGRVTVKNEAANNPHDWIGVHTYLGRYPANDPIKMYFRHLALKAVVEKKIHEGKKVIIFPESITGMFDETGKNLWQDIDLLGKKHHTHILLGGYLPVSSVRYDNVLFMMGDEGDGAQNALPARISMPVTNWRPFLPSSTGLHIGLRNNGVWTIAGRKVAFLICYEQALVWPVLQSMTGLKKPVMIVAVSNLWWAKDTGIPGIMDNICRLWGRLFSVPVLRAVNI